MGVDLALGSGRSGPAVMWWTMRPSSRVTVSGCSGWERRVKNSTWVPVCLCSASATALIRTFIPPASAVPARSAGRCAGR
ncbi:hypothetical protein G7085_13790 [Tessaracoccus sp. HDW20]|uniref:hypothetical protein n=1 Tax=Tessaracoccus coleopterorum TaxID=2714950 RepID=UPI0018D38844|nr:hypothetical protein [Tessaracoccus coleopterorum]NHB85329.1 hypothetical protein [Tessaracoccus coleopterorum]